MEIKNLGWPYQQKQSHEYLGHKRRTLLFRQTLQRTRIIRKFLPDCDCWPYFDPYFIFFKTENEVFSIFSRHRGIYAETWKQAIHNGQYWL